MTEVIPSTSQPASTKARVVRVSISSNFNDTIEDRIELMAQVWLAMRRLCRERAVELGEVDLRV